MATRDDVLKALLDLQQRGLAQHLGTRKKSGRPVFEFTSDDAVGVFLSAHQPIREAETCAMAGA